MGSIELSAKRVTVMKSLISFYCPMNGQKWAKMKIHLWSEIIKEAIMEGELT